jgi:fucose 4-O-acetylase-like acetyltransferase
MEKQRLQHIDLISGIFILQIILMHILQFADRYKGNPVFSVVMHLSFFFMPWFYFKSGYFYKSPGKVDKAYIKKKAQKLLIPYITFFIIGLIINLPFEICEAQKPAWKILLAPGYQVLRYGGGGAGNAPLWFLLSLFFTIIGYALLDQFKLKGIIIGLPVISYLLFHFDITLPLGISNLFLGIFFYWAGHMQNPDQSGHPFRPKADLRHFWGKLSHFR